MWLESSVRAGEVSSIHGLFGAGGLKCTVGLQCSYISANVTELNCTLEIQGVD